MISQRKRMLQAFLNRIAKHPILSNEHVFHRFLDGEASWVRRLPDPGRHLANVFADRGASLPPPLAGTQKHSQSPGTQPNGTRYVPRLRGASFSFARSSTTCTRPAFSGFRDIHKQIFQPFEREYGEGHPTDHEALVWLVHSQLARYIPWD